MTARHRAKRPANVADRVRDDLAKLPEALRTSALAGAAELLAERLLVAEPREAPALARELRATLDDLRARAGTPIQEDHIDQLAKRRRANRRTGTPVPKRTASTDDGRS